MYNLIKPVTKQRQSRPSIVRQQRKCYCKRKDGVFGSDPHCSKLESCSFPERKMMADNVSLVKCRNRKIEHVLSMAFIL